MLYALGEVLLVMIGILLALQVNNWNEDRKNQKEEFKLLVGLENQFYILTENLLNQAIRYDSFDRDISSILYPSKSIENLSNDDILKGLKAAKWAGTFDPGKGPLDAILESGRLEFIENDTLREHFSGWSSILDETLDGEIAMRDFIFDHVIPLMVSEEIGTDLGILANPRYIETYFDEPLDEVTLQNFRTLISQNQFIGLATWRHVWLELSKHEFYNAASKSQSILELIQRELD